LILTQFGATLPPMPKKKKSWAQIAAEAVKMADEDPEAFLVEAKMLARELGITAEQVYKKLQDDPDFLKKDARNRAISNLAKKLRKQFGL